MAIVAADIIIYGAAAMPETDSATPVGGAINRAIKILTLDMGDTGGTGQIDFVSDDAADTDQTIRITGRLADGSLVTEGPITLNGTTPVTSASQNFERILKIEIRDVTDAAVNDAAGTITFTNAAGPTIIATAEGTTASVTGLAVTFIRRPFFAALAEDAGGSPVVLYEKVFVANNHQTLALLGAKIELTFDGIDSIVDFDLEDARNDTNNTGGNRTAEPAGAGMLGAPTWADTILSVPGTDLGDEATGTSDHIGVWMRLSMAAGQAPQNTNLTFQVTGSST